MLFHFLSCFSVQLKEVENKVHYIASSSIMFYYNLVKPYRAETKVLKHTIRRNSNRFPGDFIFKLSKVEFDNLRSQFVTSKTIAETRVGRQFRLIAFTEQGVAMLSSVLRSEKAIKISKSETNQF